MPNEVEQLLRWAVFKPLPSAGQAPRMLKPTHPANPRCLLRTQSVPNSELHTGMLKGKKQSKFLSLPADGDHEKTMVNPIIKQILMINHDNC